ncbi:MAG: DUF1679 domain-containing protein [Chloroflexi bacterium]|nr:DUF1679 domain-containing protein [Chloroflexota bacterium]
MSNFPRTADEITPEWLTQALRESGAIKRARVVSIEASPLGEDSGVTAALHLLTVGYDHIEDNAPEKIVAKHPAADFGPDAPKIRIQNYSREASFYRDLAPKLDLKTPAVFFSDFIADTGHFLILVEDLSHLRSVDGSDDCNYEDAVAVFGDLARLNADWWGSPRLHEYPWLSGMYTFGTPDQLSRNFSNTLDKFVELRGEYLPAGIEELGRRLAPKFHELRVNRTNKPTTLTHGDFRTANMFFDDSQNGSTHPVVFDWQQPQAAKCGIDMAHFLGSSFSVESRRAIESDLISEYYTALIDGGVRDYTRSELEHDIREAALTRFPLRMVGLAMGGEQMLKTEQGRLNMIAMCDRLQMLIDWNCEEVIPK